MVHRALSWTWVLLPALVLSSCSESTPTAPTPPTPSATFSVTSTPSGAEIFINGASHGRTPASLAIAAGRYIVNLQGTDSYTMDSVVIVADSPVHLDRALYVRTAIYEVGPMDLDLQPYRPAADIAVTLSQTSGSTGYIIVAQNSFNTRTYFGDLYRIAFSGGSADYVRIVSDNSALYRAVALGADQSIYVMTQDNVVFEQLHRLDISGSPIHSWGGPGVGPGQFGDQPSLSGSMAVDVAGNLYAYDARNERIQKFDAAGNYVTEWPTYCCEFQWIATDASGNVYMNGGRFKSWIDQLDGNGTLLRQIPNSWAAAPFCVADSSLVLINASGALIVNDFAGMRTRGFDTHGLVPVAVTADRVGRLYLLGKAPTSNLSEVFVYEIPKVAMPASPPPRRYRAHGQKVVHWKQCTVCPTASRPMRVTVP